MLIAIDSWNYRAFNQDITPHISHFADSCSRFTSHLSSSNGTRGSIFGLFFSLSSIYWTDFEVSGIQPLLIEELLKQNYQIGIYPQCYNRQPAICQNTFLKGTPTCVPIPKEKPFMTATAVLQQIICKHSIRWAAVQTFLFLSLL